MGIDYNIYLLDQNNTVNERQILQELFVIKILALYF